MPKGRLVVGGQARIGELCRRLVELAGEKAGHTLQRQVGRDGRAGQPRSLPEWLHGIELGFGFPAETMRQMQANEILAERQATASVRSIDRRLERPLLLPEARLRQRAKPCQAER